MTDGRNVVFIVKRSVARGIQMYLSVSVTEPKALYQYKEVSNGISNCITSKMEIESPQSTHRHTFVQIYRRLFSVNTFPVCDTLPLIRNRAECGVLFCEQKPFLIRCDFQGRAQAMQYRVNIASDKVSN